ncbi:hypothetical protein FA048_10530 [Pedobacter polaris]|uniref:Uncharacterized protein n=1 Tax=Pedobacter polaris TaxID=2571273 RepID=A0A4U1CSU2_9SPHI|nr:hypothetical protein [Pedobacter polaris]TKC10606.1 hypothetical protein FA048_10530 [Pedobacter polaris]
METLKRLIFYTADLKAITGKGDRTCQNLMAQMRDFFELKKWQQPTVYQASDFLGIPLEQLVCFIRV